MTKYKPSTGSEQVPDVQTDVAGFIASQRGQSDTITWITPTGVERSLAELLEVPTKDGSRDSGSACRIADVGCGSGELTAALAERYQSATILGIEYAPGAYEVALGRFADTDHVTVIGGDAKRVLPEIEPLDVIYAVNMVQDTETPIEMIAALSEALSDDGLLILTAPDETATELFSEFAGWDDSRELPYMEMTDIEIDGEPTRWHQYAFPEDRLREIFEDCGLTVVRQGTLAADAAGLLYPMELLGDDDRREWAESMVRKQRDDPEAGPEIPLYVLKNA